MLLSFAKLDKDGLGELTREEYLKSLSLLWQEINKRDDQKMFACLFWVLG